jgi:NitT/TauT family transport system ATP-binding protein
MDLIADHISHRFGALDVLDSVSFTVALRARWWRS